MKSGRIMVQENNTTIQYEKKTSKLAVETLQTAELRLK